MWNVSIYFIPHQMEYVIFDNIFFFAFTFQSVSKTTLKPLADVVIEITHHGNTVSFKAQFRHGNQITITKISFISRSKNFSPSRWFDTLYMWCIRMDSIDSRIQNSFSCFFCILVSLLKDFCVMQTQWNVSNIQISISVFIHFLFHQMKLHFIPFSFTASYFRLYISFVYWLNSKYTDYLQTTNWNHKMEILKICNIRMLNALSHCQFATIFE